MNIQIHIADDIFRSGKDKNAPRVVVSSHLVNTDNDCRNTVLIEIGANGDSIFSTKK